VVIKELNFEKTKDLIMTMEKLKPVEGVKIIADYVLANGKGVAIIEAESIEAVFKHLAPTVQFFKSLEVSPAMPCKELREMVRELFK